MINLRNKFTTGNNVTYKEKEKEKDKNEIKKEIEEEDDNDLINLN